MGHVGYVKVPEGIQVDELCLVFLYDMWLICYNWLTVLIEWMIPNTQNTDPEIMIFIQ